MTVHGIAQPVRDPRRRREALRTGFTLVEMVVAIAVIVVLAALTVTAAIAVIEKSEVRQTENTLKLLDLALQEWESAADRKISWGKLDEPYSGATWDMLDGTPHVFTLTEVLRAISRSPNVKEILAQIDPQFVHTYDSSGQTPSWLAVLDPLDPDPNASLAPSQHDSGDWDGGLAILDTWGRPIRAVHAGRLYDTTAFPSDDFGTPDTDGTIPLIIGPPWNTYGAEQFYGACRNRRMRFVSAGPDGRFGDFAQPEETDRHAEAHDNVVSYPLEHDEE